jgi:hypothetical protein
VPHLLGTALLITSDGWLVEQDQQCCHIPATKAVGWPLVSSRVLAECPHAGSYILQDIKLLISIRQQQRHTHCRAQRIGEALAVRLRQLDSVMVHVILSLIVKQLTPWFQLTAHRPRVTAELAA